MAAKKRSPGEKFTFTEKWIRGVPPATLRLGRDGKLRKQARDEYLDDQVSNFRLVVTEAGKKHFILYRRFKRGGLPERRKIGDVMVMGLAAARDVARDWNRLADSGIDPEDERKRIEAEAEAERRRIEMETESLAPFNRVLEDYIREDLAGKRRALEDEQELRRHVAPRLGALPVVNINSGHILELAEDLKNTPATGRLVLSHVKRVFKFALHEHDKVRGNRYSLTYDPAVGVSPKRVFGPKRKRDRYLDDAEIAAAWRALDHLDDTPDAHCLRLIFYTGMRREEAAALSWKEVDFDQCLILLPAERFKSGKRFAYPLTDDAVTFLRELKRKRGKKGDYVFSNDGGKKHIDGWSVFMGKLYKLFIEELGFEPKESWSPHTVRHTVRTSFDRLRIPEPISELAIGHIKKGLVATYSHWEHLDERREAFDKWGELLSSIVTPPKSGKVVTLKRKKAS